MKKKLILLCGIVLLLIISGAIYKQMAGAPVIGTVSGAEWEYLTVNETEYEIDYAAPVNGRLSTHKEHFDISEGSNSLVQQRHAVTSFTCEIPGKNQPPR